MRSHNLLVELGAVQSVIRTRMIDGLRMYCVIGERTGRNFGCYMRREDAEARLRMIERFDMDRS